MKINVFIPQLFYDIIGRFIPGFVLLCMSILVVIPYDDISGIIEKIKLPNSLIAFSFFLLSYTVGTVLGGIWFWAKHIKSLRSRIRKARKKFPKSFVRNSIFTWFKIVKYKKEKKIPVAYKYDLIQQFLPQAGARMAKLRAEQHFCGVILIGSVILLFLYIYTYYSLLSCR